MTKQEIEASEIVSFEDLRLLARAQRPCATVAITIPIPAEIRTRLKNAVHDVEKRLRDSPLENDTVTELIDSIHSVAANIEVEGDWGIGIVFFKSPDVMRHFVMRDLLKEVVTVGDRFQIRPLLPVATREQRFFLLALSQKEVRLFRCTHQTCEELPLVKAPRNLQEWMNARIPDHTLENRSIAGPSTGRMKGVIFGTSRDPDREDEYLHHFFKEIEKAVHHVLNGENAPLMLTGVESEIAIYREINTYPHLMEQFVRGSPDGLSAVELHERAARIVLQSLAPPVKKILNAFDDFVGSRRVAFDLGEILKVGCEGRIADLLLREDAEIHGCFYDPAQLTQTAYDHANEEDLLNVAALQTILHRGQTFALKASEMPRGADSAAILRY
jgi:hypothetical protein